MTDNKIAFVDGDECGAVFDGGEEAALLVVERLRGIEDDEDECGIGECFAGATDANLLGFFQISTRGFAEAGGVDELEWNTGERDVLSDQIAGGAGGRSDDGAVALNEAIEERALADIGATDDGEGEAVVDDAATGKRGFERGQWRSERANAGGDFGLRRHVDVVFGEIDSGFKECDELDEGLLDGRDAATQRATHLAGGLAGLGECLRVDEVAHGFGLSKVEATGQEGALGELAGLGEARAEGDRAAQEQVENNGRGVCSDFYNVFRGVGVGRGEEGNDGFVDAASFRSGFGVIEDVSEARARGFEWVMEVDELCRNGCGLRTAEAHDAYAAAAGGRGDGGDGVGGFRVDG